MKKSDYFWLQGLVREVALRRRLRGPVQDSQAVSPAMLFTEEISSILTEFATTFNEMVRGIAPDVAVKVLRVGNPRPGLMVLVGREKLVVSTDGTKVFVRVIQVHAYQEQVLHDSTYSLQQGRAGTLIARDDATGETVNAELLAREYLSPFFVLGSEGVRRERFGGKGCSH